MNDFEIENDVLIKYRGKQCNITIPDSVTSIGDCAFSECENLQSITVQSDSTYTNQKAKFSQTAALAPNSLLDKKLEHWEHRLPDIGKLNRMLNYRETKRSFLAGNRIIRTVPRAKNSLTGKTT